MNQPASEASIVTAETPIPIPAMAPVLSSSGLGVIVDFEEADTELDVEVVRLIPALVEELDILAGELELLVMELEVLDVISVEIVLVVMLK
jgi:hypothetical protein